MKAVVLTLVLLGLAAGPGLAQTGPSEADLELYARQCSPCHGARGRGDGVAGRFLDPTPRNLRSDRMRFVSAANGRARDEDIARTIRQGLPGTSMLSFAHLGEERIDRLVGVVRAFQRRGLRELLRESAQSKEELEQWVREELEVGPVLPVPPPPPETTLGLARGQLSYLTACASCHGPRGRGDGDQIPRDESGKLLRPRDFTRGVLRGPRKPRDLFRRLRLGLPGSSMPALPEEILSDRETWHLVHHLRTLIPAGGERLHSTSLRELKIPRQEGAVPRSPADPRFAEAASFVLPLAPFREDELTADFLLLDLFHDGELIHFRARWSDSTRNVPSAEDPSPPDGLAARVTNRDRPPVLPIPGLPLPLDRALWLAGAMPDEDDAAFAERDPPFENPDGVCKSPIGPERVGRASWSAGQWTAVLSLEPDRGGAVRSGGHLYLSWAIFDGKWRRGPMPVAFSNWTRVTFE